jgi:hypothetical protein
MLLQDKGGTFLKKYSGFLNGLRVLVLDTADQHAVYVFHEDIMRRI